MNLLDYYIKNIISETEIERDGKKWYRVIVDTVCWGAHERKTLELSASAWNSIKADMHFVA